MRDQLLHPEMAHVSRASSAGQRRAWSATTNEEFAEIQFQSKRIRYSRALNANW
jgi:hypothetical protein